LTEQTAAALAGKQVALVDAPVPGAQWGAQAADLVFMLGGADALEARGHTAVDVVLTTMDGVVHHRQWDIAPGLPGNDLTESQHLGRFRDCMAYAAFPLAASQVDAFLAGVAAMSGLPDARSLLDCLVSSAAMQSAHGAAGRTWQPVERGGLQYSPGRPWSGAFPLRCSP
jgi:hypothetical protein